MPYEPKDHAIRYGNQWLLTDDHATEIQWVSDRAIASRHTKSWALKFQSAIAADFKTVELFPPDRLEGLTKFERESRLKRAWLARFEQEVRDHYEASWSADGFWANAHMLHGDGLSVRQAVQRIGDRNHLRLKPKSKAKQPKRAEATP